MSRTLSILIIGFVTTMVLGVLGAAALLLNRGAANTQSTPVVTLISVEQSTTTATSELPTATVTADLTTVSPTPALRADAASVVEVAVSSAIATAPAATAVLATTISVSTTAVQYVLALSDVNVRSGPGANYGGVGWVAAGQTAKVTGVSSGNGWWRVTCGDGSNGSSGQTKAGPRPI